jgi:hypothetical protein
MNTNLAPALQRPPIPRPPTKTVPSLKTSAAATAPSQLVPRRRRYRLPDHVPSFRRFKLRQGAKWTIERSTPFFGNCDIRLAAIATAPGRLTYSPPGQSRRPAVGPPVPGLQLVKVRRAGPTLTQLRCIIYVKVVLFGSAQDESNIRCRRPPLQMDDGDDHYAPAPAPPQAQQRRRCPPQGMEESGQGPRTAVAVAVASPLGVQPDINSAGISSSTGQPLGTVQLIKATPSARCYGRFSL